MTASNNTDKLSSAFTTDGFSDVFTLSSINRASLGLGFHAAMEAKNLRASATVSWYRISQMPVLADS
jgi:hypothetical protein